MWKGWNLGFQGHVPQETLFNFQFFSFLLSSFFSFSILYNFIFFLCEIVGISTFFIKTVIVPFTESLFHSCLYIIEN